MLVRYLKSKGIVAVLLILTSCADTVKDDYVEQTVETLYNKALIEMESENYTEAAIAFDEVDRQHPYSVWATKAQLMSAYALYQTNKYDEAIISLDRFIQLHPSNRDAPYAYYLKALSYYEQISD
ncbi:MAG: outer membrane protein assembly factor BamD, partial [Rhodospirillales bacterium]|nr:outer membrane protein assembly factor BamD [Rhodospirillales bacterium]